MWSDNETAEDLIDFSHLKHTVRSILDRQQLLPATIGVFGDWGCGKSSLLQMIQAELADDETLLISFNGWLFEGYEDAKSALMGTILSELESNRTLTSKGKKVLARLFNRVDKLKLAGAAIKHGLSLATGGVAGIGVSTLTAILEKFKGDPEAELEKLKELIGDSEDSEVRRSILEFRGDFEKLLEESKIGRLIVVIDDLDRCNPDTIIETLEAIKLFLFVPGSAFIIGADERLVEYAVRRKFPELPGEKVEVGRDYLEKLVQYPVRIPSLGRGETESYINLLFLDASDVSSADKKLARASILQRKKWSLSEPGFNAANATKILKELPEDLKEAFALAEAVAPILSSGLNGNPRQCKRFLNTLFVRLQMAEYRGVKLNRRILVKLMLLEHFRPESFRQLAIVQDIAGGRPKAICRLEASARGEVQDNEEYPNSFEHEELWLKDEFIVQWLSMDPRLGDVDLSTYFYFSRDKVGVLGHSVTRLSSAAEELLNQIIHPSKAKRNNGVAASKNVSPVEAAQVFEALSSRLDESDDYEDEASPFFGLIRFVGIRTELISQLISRLERIPIKDVPIGSVPVIVSSVGMDASGVRDLFTKWKNGKNKLLAGIATKQLEKKPSRKKRGNQ